LADNAVDIFVHYGQVTWSVVETVFTIGSFSNLSRIFEFRNIWVLWFTDWFPGGID
jgi:hypothetical protein